MAEEAPKITTPETTPTTTTTEHETPKSTSDLLASAKVVAAAAQQAVSKEGNSIDKAKVAGAAEDLLDAAQSYGKLDEKSGAGQYLEKAEGYLHKYHESNTAAPGGEKKEEEKSSGGSGGDDVTGGLGSLAKGIGGFFK